jgi:hypothetical protein
MKAGSILTCRDKSILLIEQRASNFTVVAVPHHAPLGVPKLPCAEHPRADENAGCVGNTLAALLNCHSIIACNYHIDSNKHEDSDYWRQLVKWSPSILIEIHGHAPRSANYDIEISCGKVERNLWSQKLATLLKQKCRTSRNLKGYTISGDFAKIRLTAVGSSTIVSDRWLSFHIELPKSLREAPRFYKPFCRYIADSLKEIEKELRSQRDAGGARP